MEHTPNLKPCPFCGCKYEKEDDDYFWAGNHEAWCPLSKEYPGQLGNLIVPDEKEYIEAWNRRASDEEDARKPEDCRYYTTNSFWGGGCLGTKEIDPCKGAVCENWTQKED